MPGGQKREEQPRLLVYVFIYLFITPINKKGAWPPNHSLGASPYPPAHLSLFRKHGWDT